MEGRTKVNALSCHGPQRFWKVSPANLTNKCGGQLVIMSSSVPSAPAWTRRQLRRSTIGCFGGFCSWSVHGSNYRIARHPCKVFPQRRPHLNLAATRSMAEVKETTWMGFLCIVDYWVLQRMPSSEASRIEWRSREGLGSVVQVGLLQVGFRHPGDHHTLAADAPPCPCVYIF